MSSYKLKKKDFVRCPTPEIARKVAQIINEQDGTSDLHHHWDDYVEKTCLSLKGYCYLEFYQRENYNEVTLEQLIQPLNQDYYELI